MQQQIIVGNSAIEGANYRGWFMGHFIPNPEDPRSTSALEIKWAMHPSGDRRPQWTQNTRVTTLSILIQGRFRLEFPDRLVILAQPGDYVLWLPEVEHCWEAEADSIVLTVRFPSIE